MYVVPSKGSYPTKRIANYARDNDGGGVGSGVVERGL